MHSAVSVYLYYISQVLRFRVCAGDARISVNPYRLGVFSGAFFLLVANLFQMFDNMYLMFSFLLFGSKKRRDT